MPCLKGTALNAVHTQVVGLLPYGNAHGRPQLLFMCCQYGLPVHLLLATGTQAVSALPVSLQRPCMRGRWRDTSNEELYSNAVPTHSPPTKEVGVELVLFEANAKEKASVDSRMRGALDTSKPGVIFDYLL